MLKSFFKVFFLLAGLAAAVAGLCRLLGDGADDYVEIYSDDEDDAF